MILSYCPPIIIQKFFKDFFWQTSNNKILLTFDDGPTEFATLQILSILKANNLKAIFFCVGENIKKYPELTEQIINDGHAIANHTMKHRRITKMNQSALIEEINSFGDILERKFGYCVKYFRPPHGRFNLRTNSLLKKQNLDCVMWSLLSHDYENNFERVKIGIDKYLRENSIIVFHDSAKSSSIIGESLNYTIKTALKKGFEFGEPEDCLK